MSEQRAAVRRDEAAPSARRAAGGRRVGNVLFHAIYRSRIIGAERVPSTGPVLLASNHTGILDGPLVYGLAPRPTHFLVKTEMFHGPAGWVLDHCGQIPIRRDTIDRGALQQALAVLRHSGVVGVFPEGSRGRGDVAAVHEGVTYLAMVSGAPVVPVACLGTRRPGGSVGQPPRPWRRVAVVFGQPVHLVPAPDLSRREASRQLTEQLRVALADHVRDSADLTGIPLYEDLHTLGLEGVS
ncbi:lysophospholipid acyltransferase family protein [Angustibacter sp. McL0619]|uniref:lysophospholipid acyltransferase family protein n=1 Tax=Angustibacter sp. McL0619 TaxID=3415676 RepID=UPI003CEBF58E